jgi:hypothetical protein
MAKQEIFRVCSVCEWQVKDCLGHPGIHPHDRHILETSVDPGRPPQFGGKAKRKGPLGRLVTPGVEYVSRGAQVHASPGGEVFPDREVRFG